MKVVMANLSIALGLLAAEGATTIDPSHRYAYAANCGWVDWRGDTNSGAVIGEFVCSGYIYAANVGWINLGSGNPTNSIRYQNLSAGDFGVNQDGFGNLRGYGYGANIGWINFESFGAPRLDLKTGKFSGYAYSANCGWISLSNASAFVQTDSIVPGPLALNGLPVAWLLANFGTTNVNPNADPDGDGMSNRQEYLAGTNPLDGNDKLQITSFSAQPGGAPATVTWQSVLTRCYLLQTTLDVASPNWLDSGLGVIAPDGAFTTRIVTQATATKRFYRVQAVNPLAP
jgi:hypothetical protein